MHKVIDTSFYRHIYTCTKHTQHTYTNTNKQTPVFSKTQNVTINTQDGINQIKLYIESGSTIFINFTIL